MTKAHVLTDTRIRGLKPAAKGQTDVKDVRSPGLFLRITTDAKTWAFRFTDPVTGKRLRMTLAKYPDLGLADARERAQELRTLVAQGVNPIEAKQRDREEAPKKTFQALADRYIQEHATRFKKSADADNRNLRLHVLPVWGKRKFAGIGRADVIELIEGLIAADKPVLANRVQALVSKIFSFAVDSALLEINPAVRLKKRAQEKAITRTLSDDEVRLFWSRISSPPLSPSTGIALKLALLTGLRAGEVAGIHRRELVDLDDPDRAAILLSGSRVKNKRDHLVPLSPIARQLVLDAQQIAGAAAANFLFPSRHGKAEALDPHALAKGMSRFAAELPDGDDTRSWKAEPPTPHDLRRSLATRLSALGVPREDRMAVLNHKDAGVHAKHYDKYERQAEKRRALNLWANALADILAGEGDRDRNVIRLRGSQ
jgi:integrase